ncbi:hypothetical protein HY17_07885 [Hyphomonas sp. CY54-11-8]|nr:hypothetical protein HY17_07885 [Hyphomonas sp. CY54-11-8]
MIAAGINLLNSIEDAVPKYPMDESFKAQFRMI